MATREIKDAKDLTTNELIYFKGHAKATYMSNGITVEDAINNIEATGGGAYTEVNHGTSDTTFTLTPNTFHVWDEVASLDLSFAEEQAGVANEYLFQFTSGSTATTLTLPDGLKWANDVVPTITANKIYQISVLKGLGSVLEFSNEVPSVFPITLTAGSTTEEGRMAYKELVNIGESGTLSEGLLVINGPGAVVHYVNSFSYNTSHDAYGLGSRGMTHYFLNVDGYCFTILID